MNYKTEHQRRMDRDSTIGNIMALTVPIGIVVGTLMGAYYYADHLNKNTLETQPSGLEVRVQEK